MRIKNFLIVYSEIAREELVGIYDWYESQQKGLGLKFFEALEEVEEAIKKMPYGYESRYRETREKNAKPFPYQVIYTVEKTNIYIHSIFPTKSKPSKKYRQIKKRK